MNAFARLRRPDADHRIGSKSHNLDQVLDGDLDALFDALSAADSGRFATITMTSRWATMRWGPSALGRRLNDPASGDRLGCCAMARRGRLGALRRW